MTDTHRSRIQDIQRDLENHIQQLDFGSQPKELYEPIAYLMGLGGKRIRPLLTLLAYTLYREDYQKILTPAVAVEVFHNFTLMHDDIMDNAPLRRGKATVHEKWDANTAILSGDVMMVRAYDMLLEVASDQLAVCMKHFNRTAAEVCEGQQLDMNFESREAVSEGEYLDMIRLKTAVLLGFSLQYGALLAGAPEEDVQRLYDFGVSIGIGFQLKDDLLDVYADKAKFGKQVGGDIIANKKTYLLIKAKELATSNEAEELRHWENAVGFDKEEKVKAVTALYDRLGIRKLTESKMEAYFAKGFEQLDQLHPHHQSALHGLRLLAEELIDREN
jgi:geranylgeranyl diphosphate synthase type II